MLNNIKTPQDALVYMTDCTLATVKTMAAQKRKSINEYRRQIIMAQICCDWMEVFKIDPKWTRAEDIIGKQTVAEWAAKIEEDWRK
jgi:hypothetical protein